MLNSQAIIAMTSHIINEPILHLMISRSVKNEYIHWKFETFDAEECGTSTLFL